jgi:hypothetical protein
MKAFTLLSLATAAAVSAKDVAYPASFNLEVVFAGKNASKTVTGEPVLFSLHNMPDDYRVGYALDWEIARGDTNLTGTLSVASVASGKAPQKAPASAKDFWLADGDVPDSDDLPAGNYTFSWTWKMMSSRKQGSIVSWSLVDEVAAGSTDFAVTKPSQKRSKDSPAFRAKLSLKSSSETPDAKKSEGLSACFDAGAGSTCAKLERAEEKFSEETGAAGKEDPDSASTRVAASSVGSLALLVAVGATLLF